jgi:hypothetical protein
MKWKALSFLVVSASSVLAQYTQQTITIRPSKANLGDDVIIEAVFYIVSHGDDYALKHSIVRSPDHPGDSLCLMNLARTPKGITLPVASYDKFADTLKDLRVGRYRLAFDSASFLEIPVKDSVYFEVAEVHVLPVFQARRQSQFAVRGWEGKLRRDVQGEGQNGMHWLQESRDAMGRRRTWNKQELASFSSPSEVFASDAAVTTEKVGR